MKLNQFLLAGLLLTAGSAFAQGAGDAGSGSMGGTTEPPTTGGTMGGTTGSMGESTDSTTMGAGSQAFTDLDSNQDGNISRDEVETDPELSAQFDDLDSDQDGQLSSEEFSEYEQQSGTEIQY